MSDPVPVGRRSGRATVIDVARAAGVSKSLVSLVMRQAPQVSDEKRTRVLAAARELGYRMNSAARSLSVQRSGTVGVLVADLGNPALVGLVDAATHVLEAAGLNPVLSAAVRAGRRSYRGELDVDAIGTLCDLRIEGLLVIGSVPDRRELVELIGDLPVVTASAKAEGLDGDAFRTDDAAGMRLVVDHLVGLGHRRIVHLGGRGGAVASDRLAGFRAAMIAHDLDPGHVAEAGFSESDGYRTAGRLLHRDPPTAVVAVNDLAAVGAMSAASDRGLDIPSEVAITGYDNSFIAAIRPVSLTSVNPATARMAELSAERLVARIGGDDRAPTDHLLVPSLVSRRSTIPHPIDRKECRHAC